MSLISRAKEAFGRARSKSPLADHLVRMQQHYGEVNGGAQAGAVTYFAFLSFFPILALAFFAVGYIAKVYPDAQNDLITAIQQVLPGIVTTASPEVAKASGQISITSIESAATAVGIVGVVGLTYAGLGWLSGMRSALEIVFEMPKSEQPNFILGKARDLVTLVLIGLTLLISVVVTGGVVGYSGDVRDLLGGGPVLGLLVQAAGILVGVGSSTLLFYVLFRLLAQPRTPRRALWQGALLGGVGFEVLKLASSFLLKLTHNQPAFQAFGIALVLLVWINYFSRLVMYAAAWAHTSRPAREARAEATLSPDAQALQARVEASRAATPGESPGSTGGRPGGRPVGTTLATTEAPDARRRPDPRLAFGAGAATALGLVALVRRRRG